MHKCVHYSRFNCQFLVGGMDCRSVSRLYMKPMAFQVLVRVKSGSGLSGLVRVRLSELPCQAADNPTQTVVMDTIHILWSCEYTFVKDTVDRVKPALM